VLEFFFPLRALLQKIFPSAPASYGCALFPLFAQVFLLQAVLNCGGHLMVTSPRYLSKPVRLPIFYPFPISVPTTFRVSSPSPLSVHSFPTAAQVPRFIQNFVGNGLFFFSPKWFLLSLGPPLRAFSSLRRRDTPIVTLSLYKCPILLPRSFQIPDALCPDVL